MSDLKKDALEYHQQGRPGKIEVIPTKPHATQKDLSLAYSPGVAEPCLAIEANPEDAYKYTAKGNLVAVISNGTAVLGLGNIGALAGKPVMEGKGLLFKIYADIDVFDIEINETDPDKLIETIKAISPTFGGINLEDIKAPECFYIEDRLKKELDIPLMHDDQHGTAIISSAALLNALEIVGKKISEVKIVVSGSGASAVSCTRLYKKLGAKSENIVMLDSNGVLNKKRTGLNTQKLEFVTDRDIDTLEEALVHADVFLGLSIAGVMKKEMLASMAANPIVFALANPNPEITYPDAKATRDDVIMATGRSDYPNQVNNVLGFPYIFRGALDVRAKVINDEMKLAAAYALANLAKLPVPEEVNAAYSSANLHFGPDYIIPKPVDPRLITTVAIAVAKAAMDTGVALNPISNWETYAEELTKRLGLFKPLIRQVRSKARANPKRVVFAEAESYKILKAAEICIEENLAKPILLGNEDRIKQLIAEYELSLDEAQIIDPRNDQEQSRRLKFADTYFNKRNRKGVTLRSAQNLMVAWNYFGLSLREHGYADAMVSGLTANYPEFLRPALRLFGKADDVHIVAGMDILLTKRGPLFFADTMVNLDPDVKTLVDITLQTASVVKKFNVEPKIALLSFSNFGSVKGIIPTKMREAITILHRDYPDLLVDGDIQGNFALNRELVKEAFPFSKLVNGPANTLIFPNLAASHIAFKLLKEGGNLESLGPVLMGLKKSVHILSLGSTVSEIVNMVSIAVMDAQQKS
ncbi:MAG: NADP-dependent malic enzyme [Saprospiraceae bacterium]|nr:NADP-dependent malic enzyme [Saprospiraceae bacterium]